jgi:hypothetical protein
MRALRAVPVLSLSWVIWVGSQGPHAGYEPAGSYASLDECSRTAARLTQEAVTAGQDRSYVCLPDRVDPRPPSSASQPGGSNLQRDASRKNSTSR